MLYSRVPIERIRTLALDEGSRTSAVLGPNPAAGAVSTSSRELRPLPIGATADQSDADAVMLIGDRGMLPARGPFEVVWDLGEEWTRWTGLPFVFAMWVARPGVDLTGWTSCSPPPATPACSVSPRSPGPASPDDRHARGGVPQLPPRQPGVPSRPAAAARAWSDSIELAGRHGLGSSGVKARLRP